MVAESSAGCQSTSAEGPSTSGASELQAVRATAVAAEVDGPLALVDGCPAEDSAMVEGLAVVEGTVVAGTWSCSYKKKTQL